MYIFFVIDTLINHLRSHLNVKRLCIFLFTEDKCPNPTCDSVPAPLIATSSADRQRDSSSGTETSVLAATTVSVLDPSDKLGRYITVYSGVIPCMSGITLHLSL